MRQVRQAGAEPPFAAPLLRRARGQAQPVLERDGGQRLGSLVLPAALLHPRRDEVRHHHRVRAPPQTPSHRRAAHKGASLPPARALRADDALAVRSQLSAGGRDGSSRHSHLRRVTCLPPLEDRALLARALAARGEADCTSEEPGAALLLPLEDGLRVGAQQVFRRRDGAAAQGGGGPAHFQLDHPALPRRHLLGPLPPADGRRERAVRLLAHGAERQAASSRRAAPPALASRDAQLLVLWALPPHPGPRPRPRVCGRAVRRLAGGAAQRGDEPRQARRRVVLGDDDAASGGAPKVWIVRS
mmetsp:Transcript_27220/g.87395  ORF Transcript_27220/g.87395 Transcript_27220/m.87395 type:complete len:301 (-) Transcript_27220:661-1563(-)